MENLAIEIYYDGMDIKKYAKYPKVSGFTTNCTFFAKWTEKNYRRFYEDCKESLEGRNFSFQIWETNSELAKKQIDEIQSIDNRIFVKIPVISIHGESTADLVQYAMSKNASMNLTCIYTKDQIDSVYDQVKEYDSPMIISIFAGPIYDTGRDAEPIVRYAVEKFSGKSNAKILWAGCREVYTIKRANDMGCHIVTAPETVLDKLADLGKDLTEASIDRAKTFEADARRSGLNIN